MQHRFVDRILFAAAAGCALAAIDRTGHASEIWRNDWYTAAPPTLNLYWPVSYDWIPGPGKPSVAVASTADGDLLFGAAAPQYLDYQFARMAADGSQRWVANIYDFDASASGAYALLPNADGGAIAALGYSPFDGDDSNRIVRIDASGAMAWSRRIPTGWLAQPSPQQLATAGCTRLSLLDATDGSLIWQRVLANGFVYCSTGGLVADAQANLYATVETALGYDATGFRTIKFDPDGNVLWEFATASPGGGSAVAVDANTLYVVTATDLRALRIADGSSAWTTPVDSFAQVLLSDDAAHEPIVIGRTSVQRIASDTGVPRWNTPLADSTRVARIIDGALLVATATGRARLDVSSGALEWNVPNDEDAGQTPDWLGFGEPENGTLAAVARVHPPAANAATVLVKRIDFATGAVVADVAVPAFARGIDGAHIVDGGTDTIGVGISEHPDHPALHLRRLDAAGTVLWEHADPLDDLGPDISYPTPVAQTGLGGDSIAVAFPLHDRDCNDANVSGWTRVALYERASGTRRWRILLRDADQQCGYTSAPRLDPLGDVYISVSALTVCPPPQTVGCQRRTLYKLAAANGAVMWRSDETAYAGIEGLVLSPQEFTLMGLDVLAAGLFSPVQRYAAADGSLQWRSNVFADQNLSEHIDKLDEHHIVVHGGFTDIRWAELDADTGNVLWSSSAPAVPCSGTFGCSYLGAARLLPDGNLLWPGDRDHKANLRRMHNDGSGIIDDWVLDPETPSLSSWIGQVVLDPSGLPHLLLRRGDRQARGSVSFFAGFDLATGRLLGQQALYAYPGDLEGDFTFPDMLKMPIVDRVLASTYSARASLASTWGAALYDMRVTAHGDLAIELGTDHAQVAPDMPLGFHAKASYSGDQAIAGASLALNLPWASGITELVCSTQSASHCTLDSRTGNLRATFDAMPGGSIMITGKVRVLDTTATPILYAFTYGPTGLSEQDTINNFARSVPTQSLFFDGFDADH